MSDLPPVAADASSYVRACGEPEAFGYHPGWIVLVLVAVFLNHWSIQILCALGIGFIIYAKRQNATLFDMVGEFVDGYPATSVSHSGVTNEQKNFFSTDRSGDLPVVGDVDLGGRVGSARRCCRH